MPQPPRPRSNLPRLEAPAPNMHVAYYQKRVNEAKDRLREGLGIDWDTAVADVCVLYNARMPKVERVVVEREAPTKQTAQPTLTGLAEDEILRQLGF